MNSIDLSTVFVDVQEHLKYTHTMMQMREIYKPLNLDAASKITEQ